MRKLLALLIITFPPFCLKAQSTIGESKENIRNIIKSNANFKLLAGNDCDTLVFTEGMQTIFNYKNDVCYKSTSVLPLNYMPALTDKMGSGSYKKKNDTTWVDTKKTRKIEVSIDKEKGLCYVTTTAL